MDIKFVATAAQRLIQEMDKYYSGIEKEKEELRIVIKNSEEWKDNQMKAFQNNINEIVGDLNRVLSLEREYMKIFYRRVIELME